MSDCDEFTILLRKILRCSCEWNWLTFELTKTKQNYFDRQEFANSLFRSGNIFQFTTFFRMKSNICLTVKF